MNIYRITIDDLLDPSEGLMAISLVDFPAVESNFLKFKDDERRHIKLKADDDQHIITGIALLADTPIYRYDPAMGGDYYIVFERETIKQLVQKYSKDGLLNLINLQHDETTYSMDSCVMIESYFTNKERGISPEEFGNIPDGSWIVSFKVTDEELWKKIKESNGEEGGLNGFSVEVCAGIAPKLKQEVKVGDVNEVKDDDLEEFIASLLALFEGDVDVEVVDGLEELVNECLSVSKNEVVDAMNARKQLEVEWRDGDKERTDKLQIKEIGKEGSKTIVNAFLPDRNVWKTIPVEKISSISITETGLVPWNYDLPSYKEIVDNPEITVTNSGIASRENIEASIDGQFFVMMEYDDETEDAAKGMRQVQVCAYGTSLAGNECFRAYEFFGATKSSLPGGVGNWRLFLTKRCRSFVLMTEAKRWGSVPPGYRTGDVDMTTIYKEIIPGGVNPYPDSTIRR